MHPEDEKRIKKAFDDAFAKKREFTEQYRLKHGDDYKLILSKGKPSYLHTGEFTGYIGSCVEVPDEIVGGGVVVGNKGIDNWEYAIKVHCCLFPVFLLCVKFDTKPQL